MSDIVFDKEKMRQALAKTGATFGCVFGNADGRRMDILKKILSNIYVDDCGCWVWQGGHSGSGRGGNYPRMCLNGSTVAVHRVMFANVHGYIPPKKQIDHICRNRLCVNPNHLEMVTHKENQRRRDRAIKGASK